MPRKIQWRFAEERDQEAMAAMHAGLEATVGRRMDCPDLLMEPVIATVVAELDGKVIQGLYAEAEIEICALSREVLSAKEMAEGAAMLEAVAAKYKIRLARCFVPQELVLEKKRPSAIERQLKKLKFTREKPGLQQFFRWLTRKD